MFFGENVIFSLPYDPHEAEEKKSLWALILAQFEDLLVRILFPRASGGSWYTTPPTAHRALV